MERKEIEKVVKEAIFKFNGLNYAAEINNEDGLATDMDIDSLDYAEAVMEIEKESGISIPDEALNIKPYYKLTVGKLVDMLYDYLKSYEKKSSIRSSNRRNICENI